MRRGPSSLEFADAAVRLWDVAHEELIETGGTVTLCQRDGTYVATFRGATAEWLVPLLYRQGIYVQHVSDAHLERARGAEV